MGWVNPLRPMMALALVVGWLVSGSAFAATTGHTTSQVPLRVEIAIKARQFVPSHVSLPVGQHVLLVFKNQDAELHAFVPTQFLENVPLHLDGNGAPQFGDKGLVRMLIPSGGRAELQFVPRTNGLYVYYCDLPGHQMFGQIVVE